MSFLTLSIRIYDNPVLYAITVHAWVHAPQRRRDMRGEVERERRGQEAMLRDLKGIAAGEGAGGGSSGNPHMPSHHSSNGNLRRNESKR